MQNAVAPCAVFLLAGIGPLVAQELPGDHPSAEDRLTLLERQVAELHTRLAVRTTQGSGALDTSEAGLRVQNRLDRIERDLAALMREVRRLSSESGTTRRSADAAERTAREALNTANRAMAR